MNRNLRQISEFYEKKDEFFSKFLLICNSKNQEQLRLQAMNLLPEWCDKAQHEIIIDSLVGLLNNSIYSEPRYYVDLERLQNWFLENHFNQNISDLKRLSEEHRKAVLEIHRNIEVKPESLEKLKLFQFLKDSGSGIYEFNSTLDLTVSSRILIQALSLLTYGTIFIDSTKYANPQYMNDVLEALLLYLRDVNHPTIKVVTILGKHDGISINEMKEFLGKYRQKIVVVGSIAGSIQDEDIADRIVVNDLSDKASTHLYTQAERPIFRSTTALSSIAKKSDDLIFLLNVLDPCDQLRKIIDNNLNEINYKSIKHWYVPRLIDPYEQSGSDLTSEWEEYTVSSKEVAIALAANDEECIPPDFQDTGRGKVFIFLNDAGFGKSSYFTWLAYCLSTFDPSLYIIKFIAMEFSTDFKRLIDNNVENLDDTQIVRLLYRYIHLALFVRSINNRDVEETDIIRKEADNCANLLTVSSSKIVLDESKTNMLSMEKLIELRLFQEKFNHQKIVLILDGFDETAPWYKDVVMKCFGRFSHLEGIRSLFLCSRPYGFEEDLKTTFEQCRMYGLNLFSEENIVISIHKFLNNKLDGYEHYAEYHQIDIVRQLNRIFSYVLKDMIRIPLLLYMVQIILLPEIKKRVNEFTHTISDEMLGDTKFDILHLVEEFVGRKMKILFTAKKGATDSAVNVPASKKFEDRFKQEIKEQHILLALYVLFDSNDRAQLLSEKERKHAIEIMEEVNQGDEKTGIVLGVQNGVPQFLHRTFAEYFTACWLFENRERFKDGTEQNRKNIFHLRTIWSDSLSKTREFFNRLILRESKGCDLHLALVNKSEEQVEKILRNNPSAVTVPDMVGRLPLHFAEYLNSFPDSIIKRIICKENNKTDQLCGWTASDYAFVLHKKKVIKLLYKRGVKPNMDILLKQVCSNPMNVLLEMALKYTNAYDEFLNRMDLAEELSERVAKILIEEKKVDIYAPRPELNSFSVLEKVISRRSISMSIHLITKSDQQKLGLDDNAERLLMTSLDKGCYGITNCIVKYHPHLFRIIIDQGRLLQCIESAIENNQLEVFKQFFHQICVEKGIECIEDENIIDNINEQGENETFGINIPFIDYCCYDYRLNIVIIFRYLQESNAEKILYLAIHCGHVKMVSYILQKANIKVTVELIGNCMEKSRKIRGINHEKCIPAFKFLLKQALVDNDADQVGMELFFMIIYQRCVYMLHSLFDIGFVPNNIMNHLNVFQQLLHELGDQRSANILVYLQQRSDLDCFDTFVYTGKSIFDLAIENECFIVAEALIEAKFGNLSNSEKEIAILDLLHQQILKYGGEVISTFIESLLFESSVEGEMANETWHSIYSCVCQKMQDELDLVENIIEKEIKILIAHKKATNVCAGSTAVTNKYEERFKKEIKEQHILLAMYVLFDKNDLEQLLSETERKHANEIMEEVNQGDGKMGIVLGVQNGVPQFLHRTFAEYFTACWLFENRKRFKDKSIFHSQTIWSDSLKKTRECFDRLILRESKDCDLHLALVNRSRTQIIHILRNNPSVITVQDMVGRLPLHFAEYLDGFEEYIIERMVCKEYNKTDQLCGWTALDYAFILDKKEIIKLLFKSGVKPNMENLFKQVCSNSMNVLLEMACNYTDTFVRLVERIDLAEELSERVAKLLIEEKKLDIYAPYAELNSFSVLENVVSGPNVSMFHHLITKSGPQKLGLDDNAQRLLMASLHQNSYGITNCIVEYHPHLSRIIIDQGRLLQCIESAIKNDQLEVFKQFFHQFCVEKGIECIEDENIIDDMNEQGENETFGLDIPFKGDCCENYWPRRFQLESNAESMLYLAIRYGHVKMVSYILQKTNIKVTVKLIGIFIKKSRKISGFYHEKCIPIFKFLFKQALVDHDADQEGMNLFFKIINRRCVYMLHSLFEIGFVPNNIMNHLNVFQQLLHELGDQRSANILVYLQQRSDLDCFDTFVYTGKSIFDLAIENEHLIVAQTLIEAKFGNLSNSEKENAILDLLQQQILKSGGEVVSTFIKSILTESSVEGEMANETWHSFYSYLFNRIPIV
uniref:ANK_REP_REGION domain-containing protein n=1 Tax=Anopheles funestus TaxID=62324 RepID=A0A182RP20_ANOFN